MKKNKVYSASDFVGMSANVLVEDSWWAVDTVSATKIGEHSRLPLFELHLKQIEMESRDVPDGYEDFSRSLAKSRTFYVREGRPLYNQLADLWKDAGSEAESLEFFVEDAMTMLTNKAFRGHVERLTGVNYNKDSRSGVSINCTKMEAWYPEDNEPGTIVGDFIYLCNKGIYTPVVEKIEEPKGPDIKDVIANLDPAVIKAIMSMKK